MYGNTTFPVAIHAICSVAALTERWKGPPAQAPVIAKSINTHEVVVRKVLSALVRAKLLQVERGARGGYTLAKPSKNISLADVYNALSKERPFELHKKKGNPMCPVSRSIKPILSPIIDDVHETVLKTLAKKTIYNLVYKMK